MLLPFSSLKKILLLTLLVLIIFAFKPWLKRNSISKPTTCLAVKTLDINFKNDLINIEEYGCKGDGFQSHDFSITNFNQLCVKSASFTNSDIGKIVSVAYAGKDEEHLVSTIKSIVNEHCVILNDNASKNVSNVLGSYGTDNLEPLNRALNNSIQKNIKLFAPKGVYLIGDLNNKTGIKWVQISLTADGQNIYMEGEGKGQTIFRELDGKTQRYGRYTKMIYLYLNNNYNLGNVTFKNFTLDKNARSLTKQLPKNEWNYEQAHSLYIAGGRKKCSPTAGDVVFKNIEVYDKISSGIAWTGFYCNVKSISLENITENTPSFRAHDKDLNSLGTWDASINNPNIFELTTKNKMGDFYTVSKEGVFKGISYKVGETLRFNGSTWLHVIKGRLTTQNNILLGERGDTEITAFSENIVFDNCNLSFVQIEPTETQLSSKEFKRFTKIYNSTIYSLQYTEAKGSDKKFSKLYCENVTSEKYLVRSLTSTAQNCNLKIVERISSFKGLISDSKIRLLYNEEENNITPVNSGYIKNNPTPNNFTFKNCFFEIDSKNNKITPKGYALKSTVTRDLTKNKIVVENCNFDKRLYGSISAYGNGNYIIKNNQLSGLTNAILLGSYKDFKSKTVLENNNYKNVNIKGGATTISINDSNLLYEIYLNERVNESEWNVKWKGMAGGLESLIKSYPTILVEDINKIKNTHLKGTKAEIINKNSNNKNYVCVKRGKGKKSNWSILK